VKERGVRDCEKKKRRKINSFRIKPLPTQTKQDFGRNNNKNNHNSRLHIKLYYMPITMVSDLQKSPHLIAYHHEAHTIINPDFADEGTKQR